MKNLFLITSLLTTGIAHASTKLTCVEASPNKLQFNFALSDLYSDGTGSAMINGLEGHYIIHEANKNTRLSGYYFVDISVKANEFSDTDRAGRVPLINLHLITKDFTELSSPIGSYISNEWVEVGRTNSSHSVIEDTIFGLECQQHD